MQKQLNLLASGRPTALEGVRSGLARILVSTALINSPEVPDAVL